MIGTTTILSALGTLAIGSGIWFGSSSLQLAGVLAVGSVWRIQKIQAMAQSEIDSAKNRCNQLIADQSDRATRLGYREGDIAGYHRGYREGKAIAVQAVVWANEPMKISQVKVTSVIDSLKADLKASQSSIASITEDRDRIKSQLTTAIARLKKIRDAERTIQESREAQIELANRQRDLVIEHGQLFGDFAATQRLNLELENQLRDIQIKLNEREREHSEAIAHTYDTAFNDGFSQASSELETERLQLVAKIESLRAQLGRENDLKDLDRVTPTLAKMIASKPIKPYMVVGSQGSGKALCTLEILRIVAGDSQVLPLVLDVSEGSDPNGSWNKAGIPCTADPEIFYQFLRQLDRALDENLMAHRNDREAFTKQPLIAVVIDEAMTAFNTLHKEKIQKIVDILTATETRGAKRKILPIFLSINEQIQNLKCQGIAVMNTGRRETYEVIALNDKLVNLSSEAELERNKPLRTYLKFWTGHYTAAILSHDTRGAWWRPIKHPSHYGQKLTNSIPGNIPEFSLAPIPNWVQGTVLGAFTAAGLNRAEPHLNPRTEPAEPLLTGDSIDSEPKLRHLALVPNSLGTEPGSDSDPADILNMHKNGMTLTQIAEHVSGVKKGGSKKFREAMELVKNTLEGE